MPRDYSYIEETSYGDAIAGELFRSFGYGRNQQSGQYEFSVSNIGRAFQEHSFWTSVDYLTLGVPAAKIGLGMYSVTRGAAATGAVGKALRAGEYAAQGRSKIMETFKAARVLRGAPVPEKTFGSTTISKARAFFESPLKFDRDSDYMKLISKADPGQQVKHVVPEAPEVLYGHDLGAWNKGSSGSLAHAASIADPGALNVIDSLRLGSADRRGTAMMLKRERGMQMRAIARKASTLSAQIGKLDPVERSWMSTALELSPTGTARAGQASTGLGTLGDAFEGSLNKQVVEALSPKARAAYERSFAFRNEVHEEAFRLNYISEDTYIKSYQRYAPHIPKERLSLDASGTPMAWASSDSFNAAIKSGTDRFRKRTGKTMEYLHDPAMQMHKVGEAAMVLAQHRYGEALARSAIGMDETRLITAFGSVDNALKQGWAKARDLFPGKAPTTGARLSALRKEYKSLELQKRQHLANVEAVNKILLSGEIKLTGMESKAFKKLVDHEIASGRAAFISPAAAERAPLTPRGFGRAEQRAADLGEEAGRTYTNPRAIGERISKKIAAHGDTLAKRMDRKAATISREQDRMRLRPMMQNVPDSLLDTYIDPMAVEDVKALFSPNAGNAISKIYNGVQAAFKMGHTAYNPATQVRNAFGAMVFHTMATGGFHSPHRGASALYNWTVGKADEFTELVGKAVESGVLGGSRTAETMRQVQLALGKEAGPHATSMDWVTRLAEGKHLSKTVPPGTMRRRIADRLAGGIQKSAAYAETVYQSVDEAVKLDAFIRLHGKYAKLGMSGDELISKSAYEVHKYFPNYAETSSFNQMFAPHIPFMSFGTEAVRVFSNAMRDKPHWAFYWNHIAESMSQAFGAMADVSPDEQEAAKSSLPWYTKDKKMLMLPWRDDDGKPHFLDLSYIIPMADMGAEAQLAERSFFGVPNPLPSLMDPSTNPVLQIIAAGVTGVSPFTGRPIEPRFMEEQMGIYLNGKGERFMAGMGEHIMRTMLPPLLPPSYAGTNLIEAIRKTKSGYTNRPMEENFARTFAMNVLGMRTYEPTVAAQLQNVKREQRLVSESTTYAWDQYEMGVANGNIEQAEAARDRIVALKDGELGVGGGLRWFENNMGAHQPGGYSNISAKDIDEVIRRSHQFNTSPTELAPLYNRLQQIRKGATR